MFLSSLLFSSFSELNRSAANYSSFPVFCLIVTTRNALYTKVQTLLQFPSSFIYGGLTFFILPPGNTTTSLLLLAITLQVSDLQQQQPSISRHQENIFKKNYYYRKKNSSSLRESLDPWKNIKKTYKKCFSPSHCRCRSIPFYLFIKFRPRSFFLLLPCSYLRSTRGIKAEKRSRKKNDYPARKWSWWRVFLFFLLLLRPLPGTKNQDKDTFLDVAFNILDSSCFARQRLLCSFLAFTSSAFTKKRALH